MAARRRLGGSGASRSGTRRFEPAFRSGRRNKQEAGRVMILESVRRDHGTNRLKQARVNGVNNEILEAAMTRFARFIPALTAADDPRRHRRPGLRRRGCEVELRRPVERVDRHPEGHLRPRLPLSGQDRATVRSAMRATRAFNVSGKVGDNGTVTVTVSRGSQSAKRPGPPVGDRRVRHVDRRLGRVLRHLDGRAPLLVNLRTSSRIPKPRRPAPGSALAPRYREIRSAPMAVPGA